MIEHIFYKPEHAKDIIEQGAVNLCDMPKERRDAIANSGEAWTCVYNGRIVSCGGYELLWKGVGQAWFICVTDINLMVLKENKRKFLKVVKNAELWRVQAPMSPDFGIGIRFTEYMGFEHEATLVKYNADKSDVLLYTLRNI